MAACLNAQAGAPTEPSAKNPAAVALGRLGGLKGGVARAAKRGPIQTSPLPNILAPYLDHEIGQAYHIYSEDFHAAGWQGESDWKDFIEWMTESPIEGIVKRGKSEAQ